MNTVHAKFVGDKALLSQEELGRLAELARHAEDIELRIENEDIPAPVLMRLAEQAGSFGLWTEQGEDIYSTEDGEPL